MGYTRTTFGGVGGKKYPSHLPGDITGLGVNSYALGKFKDSLSGNKIAAVLLWALEPAFEEAMNDWPVVTGASKDTIRLEIDEEGTYYARASIKVGGEQLIQDPRNKKGIDYAPFVEFNGTSKTPPGTITRAMIVNQEVIKERLTEGLRALMGEALGE